MSLFNLPDRNLDPPEYKEPHCPCCGKVCDFIFTTNDGDVVGCENCITRQNSEDVSACYDD